MDVRSLLGELRNSSNSAMHVRASMACGANSADAQCRSESHRSVDDPDLFLKRPWNLLPVLRLLTPCRGATIRFCLPSRRTTRSSTATAAARRCYSTSLDRVPFHGRAAQRDCHRASVWTRYFSVEPYTERAGLNGTALVNLSKDDCRRSAARGFSRFKSPGHGKFRQAGVASDPCARPVVRSSWSPDGWRLLDCAANRSRIFSSIPLIARLPPADLHRAADWYAVSSREEASGLPSHPFEPAPNQGRVLAGNILGPLDFLNSRYSRSG